MSTATATGKALQKVADLPHIGTTHGRGIKPFPGLRVQYGTPQDAGPFLGVIVSVNEHGAWVQGAEDDPDDLTAVKWGQMDAWIDPTMGLDVDPKPMLCLAESETPAA